MDVTLQGEIDRKLCELDGTPNKERLGGNAILAVSVAVARAGARASKLPLYQYLNREKSSFKMPDILATVIAGGVFSTSGMEFEDYMMALSGFDNFPDELEALSSMRMLLEKKLKKAGIPNYLYNLVINLIIVIQCRRRFHEKNHLFRQCRDNRSAYRCAKFNDTLLLR